MEQAMTRRGSQLIGATLGIASGLWALPGAVAAQEAPEADPGAGTGGSNEVPPDIQAELAADTISMQTHHLLAAPPSHQEMLAAASGSAAEAPSGGPVLVAGTVTSVPTSSAGGELLVLLADERPVSSNEPTPLAPLVRVPLGSSGAFSVSPQITDRVRAQMLEGGQVNLILTGTLGGRSFTSRVVRTFDAANGRWRTSTGTAPSGLELVADGPVSSIPDQVVRSAAATTCSSHTSRTFSVKSIVAEVHNSSLFNGSFSYGTKADSELGALVKIGEGPWKVTGSVAVKNSVSATASLQTAANSHWYLKSTFLYREVLNTCSTSTTYTYWSDIEPYAWAGGLEKTSAIPAKYCGGTDWNYKVRHDAGTSFKRTTGKAMTWRAGLEIKGFSLTARSGFTTTVTQSWKAGKQASYICGNGAFPTFATRIFTSNTVAQ